MKIYFIRHGETTGDVENLYGGTYDDHLTEKGKGQSLSLAEKLADKNIEGIFSSSLIRAQETSDICAETWNCSVHVVDELRERNQYSFLSGKNKDEAKVNYPKEVEMLKERMNTIEGAESYEDFSVRISDAFDSIVTDDTYETLAIISHGGPLRALFRDILKWGEITDIQDCAWVELEKSNEVYYYIDSGKFKPEFDLNTWRRL